MFYTDKKLNTKSIKQKEKICFMSALSYTLLVYAVLFAVQLLIEGFLPSNNPVFWTFGLQFLWAFLDKLLNLEYYTYDLFWKKVDSVFYVFISLSWVGVIVLDFKQDWKHIKKL